MDWENSDGQLYLMRLSKEREHERNEMSSGAVIVILILAFMGFAAHALPAEREVSLDTNQKIILWQRGTTFTVKLTVPHDELNRGVWLYATPSSPFGDEQASYLQLDGEESPRVRQITFRHIVPAEYTISARLLRSDGKTFRDSMVIYVQ